MSDAISNEKRGRLTKIHNMKISRKLQKYFSTLLLRKFNSISGKEITKLLRCVTSWKMSLLIFLSPFRSIFVTREQDETSPEQQKDDKHNTRRYNEVFEKQPAMKVTKNGNSKFIEKYCHDE